MVTILLIIAILSVLVFIHELGHLYVAKKANVLCYEFAVGMGPKLFSFFIGETEYSIRLLPFGGFVRMAMEGEKYFIEPDDKVYIELNEKMEVIKIADNTKYVSDKAKLVTVTHFDVENTQTLQVVEDNKTYRLHDHAVIVYNHKMSKKIAPKDRIFENKKLIERAVIILAGPLMNILLAIVIMTSIGMIIGKPIEELYVGDIREGSAAEIYGLQQNDFILSVNKKSVHTWNELTDTIKQYPNKEIRLTIIRDNNEKIINLVPNEIRTGTGEVVGYLGVIQSRETSLPYAIEFGVKETYGLSKMLLSGIVNLVVGHFQLEDITGPVGVYENTQKATEGGILVLFLWISLLSVNLAVFNLLPIPALDGGRILFIIIEFVRGKPINAKYESVVHILGFLAMICLIVIVTFSDILRLLF